MEDGLRLAVSGSRTPDAEREFDVVYQGLRDVAESFQVGAVVTGAQHGVDSAAYTWAQVVWPDAEQVVVFPEGLAYNETLVADARRRGHTVVACPRGYLARNRMMVERADLLVAFPLTAFEQLRSGTWATVREANRRRLASRIYPLDGGQA